VYLRKQNASLAREQINAALDTAPGHPQALMLRGALAVMEKDLDGAVDAYGKVVEDSPRFAPAYARLGMVYLMKEDEEKAKETFEEGLAIDPPHPQALEALVNMDLRAGRFDEALALCRRVSERAGENTSLLAFTDYLQGRVLAAKGDIAGAKERFEEAVSNDPRMLAAYMAMAQVAAREGEADEMISHYETVLERRPDYLAAHMALGAIYDRKGEAEKAEEYYREALKVREDFAPAANNLAWSLAQREADLNEALELARLAKRHLPDDPNVMDTLGWVYYLMGSYQNALAELQESLTRNPNNAIVNYHMGKVLYKTEEYEKAREYMAKALELDPDFPWADDARRLLN